MGGIKGGFYQKVTTTYKYSSTVRCTLLKKHKVKKGQNPTSIAKKYGASVKELMKDNKIKNPRRLQIGTILTVKKPIPCSK
ncbi:MAG: LysM peptidoglycan-binding domain-containing protein [Candidatus Saganbacteria bacterium]|nr:LysM peptidoglycan-binding domain-containing protein [Candidatus Saganbacteria bacterium]